MIGQRLIFYSSLILMSFCGVLVVVMDTWSKGGSQYYQHTLNKGLWKFDTEESVLCKKYEKVWAWRKLSLAGLMIACVFVAVFNRVVSFPIIIAVPLVFYFLWILVLVIYWHYYIVTVKSVRISGNDDDLSSELSSKDNQEKLVGWKCRLKDRTRDSRLPVTIVTGYLGSGKTTLVKGLLTNTVGMKILVIENEIGTEGIDHDLLLQHTAKEEIILMNNGCICCTVRSDLLKTFHRLFADDSFSKLDWVVIETTGLADPAPLIQSLYMDDECRDRLRMDSVVTVLDCKHFPSHITPVVKSADEDVVFTSMKGAAAVKTQRSTPAKGAHGGNLSEAVLQVSFADRVILNKIDLVTQSELDDVMRMVACINPSVSMLACQHGCVPPADLLNIRAFDPTRNKAILDLSSSGGAIVSPPILIRRDATGKILRQKVSVNFGESSKVSEIRSDISTVSLTCSEALSLAQFNIWLSVLLKEKGEDLFRLKGILSFAGHDQQFVAQGVHMIFDGERGPLWGAQPADQPRRSRLVLIGKNLNAAELELGFLACKHIIVS